MYQKKFSMTHVIKNLLALQVSDSQCQVHFGVPWIIRAKHVDAYFSLFLCCQVDDTVKKPWCVDIDYEFRIVAAIGKPQSKACGFYKFEEKMGWGFTEFHTWEFMLRNHADDKALTVECDVTIKSMTGIARKRKLSFDNPRENLTDMVLKVGEKKFNVSKVLLASFSPYFNALFFSNFSESKKSEIELKEVDPEDFQQLLEVIYGALFLKSDNVEALLYLADRFDMKVIHKRCEEFLTNSSEMTNKNKLRIADAHNLEDVKNHCLRDVKTADEVRDLVPTDLSALNPTTLVKLLQITLTPP